MHIEEAEISGSFAYELKLVFTTILSPALQTNKCKLFNAWDAHQQTFKSITELCYYFVTSHSRFTAYKTTTPVGAGRLCRRQMVSVRVIIRRI